VPVNSEQILYASAFGPYVLDGRRLCWSAAARGHVEANLSALVGRGALSIGEVDASGGSVPVSATYTPGPSTCTAATARVQEAISAQLMPTGREASVLAVSEHGYRLVLKLPDPGSIAIDWYLRLPSRRHSLQPGLPSQMLVAAGHARSAHGGVVSLTLRLTSAGKSAFAESRNVAIDAKATFAPRRARRITTVRSFILNECPPHLVSNGVACVTRPAF
jgi:hypothetical protein